MRDRLDALEKVVERLCRLDRLRRLELCLIAPAMEPGWQKAFFVSGGAIAFLQVLVQGATARIEIEAGLAVCRSVGEPDETLTAGEAEDLMLLHGFIRRPPPELAVLPLDLDRIAEQLSRRHLPHAA